jgi:FMN reductase
VRRLVEAMRAADALILSTAAYHGTLAGLTKNALDFTQFLARDERPYLDGRVVGLISTAGGERAAANTTDAMVHVVHALRGIVAPSLVTISKAWQRSDDEGNISDEDYGKRLDKLGKLVVEMAEGLNPENRRVEAVGVAV